MAVPPLMTTAVLLRPGDLEVAARTVWGEARGEKLPGWYAVAWVIRNRAEWGPAPWWGSTIPEVCRKAWQFSCWNPGDPNASLLAGPADDLPGYGDIFSAVSRVMTGEIPDLTGRASHYKVRGTPASWDLAVAKRGITPVSIGRHDFYALGPG